MKTAFERAPRPARDALLGMIGYDSTLPEGFEV
jgi:hypothetical protein